MAMNPEIKEAWANACEDPHRRQATGILRSNTGAQCCLDVLNELAVKAGVIQAPIIRTYDPEEFWGDPEGPEMSEDHYSYDVGGGKYEYEILPPATMDWAELTSNDPKVMYEGEMTKLSDLNDSVQLSLPEIGDIIRNSDL